MCCKAIFQGGVLESHICPKHPWQRETCAVGKVTQNGWSSIVLSVSSQSWDDVSVGNQWTELVLHRVAKVSGTAVAGLDAYMGLPEY